MSKKPPSPLIASSEAQAGQQQKAGQANIQQGTSLTEQAVNNPTSSPLYKALYNTQAGQMSQAYDNAASSSAARARQAGFGYQQPAAQGAQDQIRSKEASSIGQLPGQVAAETVPMELQAGGQLQQTGLGQEGQGNQLEAQVTTPLEEQYQKYSLAYKPLWQRIGGGALGALGSVTGNPFLAAAGGAIGS